MAALCGRDAAAAERPRPTARLGEPSETDWQAADRPRRRRPRRHLHAGRHATPRSRSRRSRRASTCCARSRWPTPSPRPRRWSRPPSGPRRAGVRSMVGLQLPPGARRSRWPGSWSPRAGSARSGTCARSTCRTGSSTRSSRWSGGCSRTRPAPARSATSARTSSTWRSSSPASGSPGCPALTETFVKERPLPDGVQRACPRPGGSERGPVTVDDAALFIGALRRRARSASFEATRFATGRKNAMRIEVNGSRGQSLAFDFESMNELSFYDGTEDAATAGFRRILVTEPDAPVRRRLVAARPRARLRAHLHPRGRRPRDATSPRAATRGRRSPTGCRCSGCSPPSRRSRRETRQRLAARPIIDRGGTRMARPITLFTGQWADLPFEEVCRLASRVGLRRPRDRLLGRPLRGRQGRSSDDALRRAAAATCSPSTASSVYAISNHLVGQAVCDDPIDERHQGILPARDLGRRRPRGRAAAGRRGDEGHRAGRGQARRRHRRRLHRLVDLEDRRDVPAGARRR